jgi:uncharacterized protein (TIGR02145 family)
MKKGIILVVFIFVGIRILGQVKIGSPTTVKPPPASIPASSSRPVKPAPSQLPVTKDEKEPYSYLLVSTDIDIRLTVNYSQTYYDVLATEAGRRIPLESGANVIKVIPLDGGLDGYTETIILDKPGNRLFKVALGLKRSLELQKKKEVVIVKKEDYGSPQTTEVLVQTSLDVAITSTTATILGTITSDGGTFVTTRGVVWSTTANPSISLTTKTINGTGTGTFISNLTGLIPNTTYHVRGYATTSLGTEYGAEFTFVTPEEAKVVTRTVTIGNQIWQTENLNVDRFRNGESIPQAQSEEAWKEARENRQPAWCYQHNDPENGKIYGKLYNWYAVGDRRGICPEGWHVPSHTEWTNLTNYLGGKKIAGGKMKSNGTTYWVSPNEGATNESGFTGLPGGYHLYNGDFSRLGVVGVWWSSSEFDRGIARNLKLYYGDGLVTRSYDAKATGLSVRCLSD